MLPGATEKQMSFWWQELGGWLSASIYHLGVWGKEQFLLFFEAVSLRESRRDRQKRATQISSFCQGFCQAFLQGSTRGSADPTTATPQTQKDSWSCSYELLQADSSLTKTVARPKAPRCRWSSCRVWTAQSTRSHHLMSSHRLCLWSHSARDGQERQRPKRGSFQSLRLKIQWRFCPNGRSKGASYSAAIPNKTQYENYFHHCLSHPLPTPHLQTRMFSFLLANQPTNLTNRPPRLFLRTAGDRDTYVQVTTLQLHPKN